MQVIIEVRNRQKTVPLETRRINRIIKAVLAHEGVPKAQLSVALVTDREIKSINKMYHHRNYPTDVLAFDYRSGRTKYIDGEIIVSTVTARRNAGRFRTSPAGEVILYIVHGILHLLGYDDHTAKDIKRMRAKERELMRITLLMTNDK